MDDQSSSTEPWPALRRQMPVAEQWAFFNNAAVAPISGPARDAMTAWAADMAAHGNTNWARWHERVERGRSLGAALVGADTSKMALVRNTTEGINLVAEGYPWRDGDNVVTFAGEFPSNLYPWMNLRRRGVEVRQVPTQDERVRLGDVAARCDGRTRIVTVSWVGFATGWRNDLDALAEIAHRAGALLFVDAIQGLGILPLDVNQTPIDFLAADGHKWLLGPEGAGLLYVRRANLARLEPLGLGWNSVVHAGDYSNPALDLKPTAERYEGGSMNVAGFVGLAASLELLAAFGTEAISRRVLELAELICRRLEAIGAVIASCREPAHRSGIVSFDLPGRDLKQVRRGCLEQGVVLSHRGGRLRASAHAYNNEDDVERLITALTAGGRAAEA